MTDLSTLLTSLELNGNTKRLFNARLSYMQVVALCEVLYEDTSIVSIDLSYNNLNDMAAQALARLVKVNRTLKFLNLGGNDVTAVGAAHLAGALEAPGCTLQVLLLPGNPLGDEGVSALGGALPKNTSLVALDLCNTQTGIPGIIAVCTALGDGGSDGEGGSGNSTLESLDLGRPLLPGQQDTTSLAVARMLASNTTLRSLSLSKHGLTDGQLDTLVTYGLLRNSTIAALDLRANKLSPFASLLLWGNNFGPAASRTFLDTLAAIGDGALTIDIKPYAVDGVAQVALLEL
ncbi:hypothetical protein FOA52_006840 [Chlamydomonas sp. UWO 241]|nr:hypothetical protein FOA52_006840 [Chlamydomonas sp. UWO 241]